MQELVDGQHAGPRPARVVHLRRLERLAQLGVPVGIAGPVERQHRDVVHPQVIGVRVAPLVVAVGEDDLRLRAPDDRHQAAGGLVDVGHVERVGVLVRRRVGHAGVAVAEHHDLVEADDAGRLGQLGRAHRGDLGLLLLGRQAVERLALGAQRRVLQLALLAARAAHEHRVDALGVVPGDRRGALRRLVVGVGVDGEQGEPRRGAGLRHQPASPGGTGTVTRSTLPAPCHDESGHVRSPAVRARSIVTAAVAAVLVVVAAACDTGDGKTLRPPTSAERAAQPTTTTSTTVPGTGLDVDGGTTFPAVVPHLRDRHRPVHPDPAVGRGRGHRRHGSRATAATCRR